jgi:hypothetical protein
MQPTDIVRMNRAIAVAELSGPEAGLDALATVHLDSYHLFHATCAELLTRAGHTKPTPPTNGPSNSPQRHRTAIPHPTIPQRTTIGVAKRTSALTGVNAASGLLRPKLDGRSIVRERIGNRREICFVAGKDRISQTNRKDYKMGIDHVRGA